METYGRHMIATVLQRQQQVERDTPVTTSKNPKASTVRFHVLDVAGGNGDLSWLMCNVHENILPIVTNNTSTTTTTDCLQQQHRRLPITSTVLDPLGRTRNNNHIVKSVRYLRQQHPDEVARRAVPGLPTHQPLALLVQQGKLPQQQQSQQGSLDSRNENDNDDDDDDQDEFETPRQLRLALNEELVEMIRGLGVVKESEQRPRRSATETQVVFDEDVKEGDGSGSLFLRVTTDELNQWRQFWAKTNNEHEEAAPGVFAAADQALDAILSTDLVCGFHPDQATEACIDLAFVLGAPFCIVPCCVFPAEFPHRRLLPTEDGGGRSRDYDVDDLIDPSKDEGERVRTYHQLLAYLQQKCPEAKQDFLPFVFTETAKNGVLYSTPDDIGGAP